MSGIRIAHLVKASPHPSGVIIHTVPISRKPLFGDSLKRCPTCQVIHAVKTVHLWLDDAGTCLVSKGVLSDLQSAGMPDLAIVGEVKAPPALNIGERREVTDSANRRISLWTSRESQVV
jgi:hypothetical protein